MIMDQNNKGVTNNFSLEQILAALRKNWILILIFVIMFSAIGVLYGRFQKPVYTARHQAFYSTHNIMVSDPNSAEHINAARAYMDTVADFADEEFVIKRADYGEYLKQKNVNSSLTVKQFLNGLNDTTYKKYDFSGTTELLQSSVDVFFTQEVLENKTLVDRTYVLRGILTQRGDNTLTVKTYGGTDVEVSANDLLYVKKTDKYMSEYSFYDLVLLSAGDNIKVHMTTSTGTTPTELSGVYVSKTDSDMTVDVNGVEVKINTDNFKKATLILPSYFLASNVGVDYSNGSDNSDESFVFTFRYTDNTPQLAIDKVQFIIKSMAIEATRLSYDLNEAKLAKFVLFKNVEVTIEGSAGYLYYSSSVSKTKTLIMFVVIGFVAGCLIAYIKELLDLTIKRKDDLEAITDTNVLTIIPAEGDE